MHGDTVWGPQSMNDGDSLDINRSVPFSSTAKIRLYDADTGIFDNDDFLGEVTATASQANRGEQYATFTQDGANYQLTYRVVARPLVMAGSLDHQPFQLAHSVEKTSYLPNQHKRLAKRFTII